ncbi:MAG: cytochrome P450 [Solirubrobacterales bacterium]
MATETATRPAELGERRSSTRPGPALDGLPPGPRLPLAVQTARLMARPVPFLEDCRRRFGETFSARLLRAGRMVFISDPASLKRLFSADRENTLSPGRNAILAPLLGRRSLLVLEGEDHMRRRRLMLPPFHGERMRAYETVMADAAEREVSEWPLDAPFRLHPSMQAITLEVILRAVFGVEDDRRRTELRRSLVAILSTTRSPLAIGLTIPGVRRLPAYRRMAAKVADADRLLFAEIAERRADPGLAERSDILSMLVAARFDDGSSMTDVELRDQLMTLLLAGHETTATALAWAFDLLFRAPDAFERVRAEVDGGGDAYLDAAVEETLRIRPVVPFVGRQLSSATELGGYMLPAATVVMPAIYLAHTRPEAFPDPYAFRPERFLDGGPPTYSWVPFGGGTRRCIGAAFAQFEMRVVLRTILSRARLAPASEGPERIVRRNVTLSPRDGTPALLLERR